MPLETRTISRIALAAAGFYFLGLLAVIVYAANSYGPLYATSTWGAEAQLFGDYHQFLRGAGMGLAGYLLIWSVGFGLWKDAYWKGLLALAVGFAVTALALGALPYVRFPNDQYPPEALWITGSIRVRPIPWAAFPLAGRWFLKRPLLHA